MVVNANFKIAIFQLYRGVSNEEHKNTTHTVGTVLKFIRKNRRNRGKMDNSSFFIRPAKWVVMYTFVREY